MALTEIKGIDYNEKIVTKHSRGFEYDYSTSALLEIRVSNYSTLFYLNNTGNCKVGTLLRLQDCLASDRNGTIKRVKELFSEASRKFGFKATFNDFDYVRLLVKEFKPVYILRVPIKGDESFQYHCMFWTGRLDGPGYRGYKKRVSKKGCQLLDEKGNVIPNLKKPFTDKQFNKIKSYKSKGALRNYVQKLINGETV